MGMNARICNVFIMFQADPKSPVTTPAPIAADITDLLVFSVDWLIVSACYLSVTGNASSETSDSTAFNKPES